jgi:hypothetical protein
MLTRLSLVAALFALAVGSSTEANERDTQRYAQASPAPADAAAPSAAPATTPPAAPAMPAPVTVAPASPPAATAPSPATPAAPATAAAPGMPARLSGLVAWSALVGNSISGMDDGKPLVEYYAADGTTKSMHGNEISRGTWALVGETICFKYESETECYRLEVIENTATFTDAKGNGTRYDILKGNPKNL